MSKAVTLAAFLCDKKKSTKDMPFISFIFTIIGTGIVLVVYMLVGLLKWLSSLCSPTRQKAKPNRAPQALDERYLVYENDEEWCYYYPAEDQYYYYKKHICDKSDTWNVGNILPDVTPSHTPSHHAVADDIRFSSPDELFYEPDYNDTRYDDMMEGEDKDW